MNFEAEYQNLLDRIAFLEIEIQFIKNDFLRVGKNISPEEETNINADLKTINLFIKQLSALTDPNEIEHNIQNANEMMDVVSTDLDSLRRQL